MASIVWEHLCRLSRIGWPANYACNDKILQLAARRYLVEKAQAQLVAVRILEAVLYMKGRLLSCTCL